MKSIVLFTFSFFLAITIIAPSLAVLVDFNENMELIMDYGEDENQKEGKEGEKEIADKDTFYHNWHNPLSSILDEKATSKTFYIEGCYNHTRDIFLPPPEQI
ncbi:MAG: hypothetical protein KAJ23_13940 [Maribacter sp.]|nr:hypothetical protein [Maribacter sp.]